MEVLALLHNAVDVFTSLLGKSGNMKASQYDFSYFLVHPGLPRFQKVGENMPPVPVVAPPLCQVATYGDDLPSATTQD